MNRSCSAGPERRRARLLGIVPLIVAPLVGLLEPSAASAASAGTPTPSGERTVVVQFAPDVSRVSSILGSVHASRAVAATGERYVLSVPAGQAESVQARLAAEPGVVYADVARPVHAAVTPDDQCYTSGCVATDDSGSAAVRHQAYLNTIGAPAAWDVSKGNGVTVAIIDSGVDPGQPDLQGKLVPHGSYYEVNVCGTSAQPDPLCQPAPGQPPEDQLGHGTHVSGLAGADTNNNGLEVASLGWNVRLDEYQVLDSQGNGNTADVATAIYDAVRAGDRVISMSLANYSCGYNPADCGPDPDEEAAVEYAIAHNVVVVAAAGNDGLDSPAYPASYPGVLSVAATDDSGVVQSFSQWGSAANIAAPGADIVSTWPTYAINNSLCVNLCVESGTSMATPQVSAAAALVISRYPALSSSQVVKVLESSARPTTGGHPIYGGLLDVPAALAAGAHPPTSYNGYVMAGSDGSAYSFGSVGAFGSLRGIPLARPVVGTALVPDGRGYWMVASDGGVFTFGDAAFHGSTGGVQLNKPIVGMAPTADGRGYWLVASDGGIFAFGDARFYGSTGGITLNKPVVGMAATPDGRGYWLVASDGGIFAFGDAHFYGSTGGVTLNKPVVGIAATPAGNGYWMVASDGGVFAFGAAGFHGSTGGITLARPVVGLAATPTGNGYWMVASDGGVFNYGDSRFYGSTGGQPIPAPVVGVAS